MRVRIIVEADRLGDVDVTRENYYRQIDADPKDVLHGVLSDAVAQIQDAYRLRPLRATFVAEPKSCEVCREMEARRARARQR